MESRCPSSLLAGLNNLKWRVAGKGVLVGFVAGLLAAAYRLIIERGTEFAAGVFDQLRAKPIWIPVWIGAALLAGYLLSLLIRCEPYAKGSGIPQVEGIVLLGMKIRWYTVLAVRFLAGALGSVFGLSLGREGPSIQIGAAGGQAVCKVTSRDKQEENYLITAGAAAGLSAAFCAPLSGILFCLEEVHRSFSPLILLAATTAALTADVVSKTIFGLTPVLAYGDIAPIPLSAYPWLIVVGLACGLIGALANKWLLAAGTWYNRLPAWSRPMLALLLALPCGLLLPSVLGGGQNLIHLSQGTSVTLGTLALLLVVKLAFTGTSFGSGTPGGIFMPLLAIGALTGCLVARLLAPLGLPIGAVAAFSVCAMAGVLSAAVKAPITSILLMAEMTGSLVHLLPVAAVAFLALLVSDLLRVSPIYEVLLERLRGADGAQTPHKRGALVELPVELGSETDGKRICEIRWPEGALVVGVRRGEREFVPNGNTRLIHGDYITALSGERCFAETRAELSELCRAKEA